MSLQTLLDALSVYKLRSTGPDRYRAVCPVCGERSPNTLSVGVTADGAVLLKCFKLGCGVESICTALGLEIADLFPPLERQTAPMRRPRLVSAQQALALLDDEARLVAVAAANVAHGTTLSPEECNRVLKAAGRIAVLRDEVMK